VSFPRPLSPFTKLASPRGYVACAWDLSIDTEGRLYWVDFFKRHLNTILKLGVEAAVVRGEAEASAVARADECRAEFYAFFDKVGRRPRDFGRVTILSLDAWRDELLRKHGFVDAFIDLKNRENEKMLPLLSVVCKQLDAITNIDEQIRALVEGIFAGNIFDMGAEATAKAFLGQSPDFFTIRTTLTPRPWLIDDYDALAARLRDKRYRKAVFFIDNAGSDFLLGALPFMRWLARRGTTVILAANELPSLNDMTIHDVSTWWPRIVAAEPSLQDLPITGVSTGTGEPLIDLGMVSDALNAASHHADLVILEGMGRGVESNLEAEFNCDALNIAMLKDTMVAKRNGGKVFDLVCRFRAAT